MVMGGRGTGVLRGGAADGDTSGGGGAGREG